MAFKKNLPPFVLPTVLNLSSSQKKKKKVKNTMTFGKSFKNDSWDWKFGGLLLKMPYHVLKLGDIKKPKNCAFCKVSFFSFKKALSKNRVKRTECRQSY